VSGKPAHESDTSPVADDAAQDETLDEPQDETAQAQQEPQAPTSEGPGNSASAPDAAEQPEEVSASDAADQPEKPDATGKPGQAGKPSAKGTSRRAMFTGAGLGAALAGLAECADVWRDDDHGAAGNAGDGLDRCEQVGFLAAASHGDEDAGQVVTGKLPSDLLGHCLVCGAAEQWPGNTGVWSDVLALVCDAEAAGADEDAPGDEQHGLGQQAPGDAPGDEWGGEGDRDNAQQGDEDGAHIRSFPR